MALEEGNKIIYRGCADRIFDKRYNSPNPLRRYVHRAQYQSIIDQVAVSDTIIDVGCGEGVLACLLAEKGARVTGVDISEPNIVAARELAKRMGVEARVTFLVGDAEAAPFPDASFDTVISCHVLEHLPDFNKGLSELYRLTKKKIITALPTLLNFCSIIQVGQGSFWELSRRSALALPRGLIWALARIFSEGVDEGYMGKKELMHIFRWPWIVRRRLKHPDFVITHFEASTLSLPYFSFWLPLMRTLDKGRAWPILRNFGYGSTVVLEKLETRN